MLNSKPKAPPVNNKAVYPMQLVSTDMLEPLPESSSGNSYYSCCSGLFYPLDWGILYQLPRSRSCCVDEMFCCFSPQDQLHSDQGCQFQLQLLKEVCKLLGIQKSWTMPYHSQCDGGGIEHFCRAWPPVWRITGMSSWDISVWSRFRLDVRMTGKVASLADV